MTKQNYPLSHSPRLSRNYGFVALMRRWLPVSFLPEIQYLTFLAIHTFSAMSYPPAPNHMRVPEHLSEAALHQALEELNSKIKTLRNRAHATTATSQHTYHQHIAALEVKRAKLAERLGPSAAAGSQPAPPANPADRTTWDEIWQGIENLRDDLRNII